MWRRRRDRPPSLPFSYDADLSAQTLDSAILDSLVESFALNQASLMDDVIFEWDGPSAPPTTAEVAAAVDELLARGWLRETEESDEGKRYLVVRLTDEGKAEWRRRNPLEQRLDKAWFAQGDFIYAPSEELADRAAKYLEEFGFGDVDVSAKSIEPWTYELDDSGDVIHGVRVEYPRIRRVRRLWSALTRRD
jgi:DNA-binding PadR family transcriptional regulator